MVWPAACTCPIRRRGNGPVRLDDQTLFKCTTCELDIRFGLDQQFISNDETIRPFSSEAREDKHKQDLVAGAETIFRNAMDTGRPRVLTLVVEIERRVVRALPALIVQFTTWANAQLHANATDHAFAFAIDTVQTLSGVGRLNDDRSVGYLRNLIIESRIGWMKTRDLKGLFGVRSQVRPGIRGRRRVRYKRIHTIGGVCG